MNTLSIVSLFGFSIDRGQPSVQTIEKPEPDNTKQSVADTSEEAVSEAFEQPAVVPTEYPSKDIFEPLVPGPNNPLLPETTEQSSKESIEPRSVKMLSSIIVS